MVQMSGTFLYASFFLFLAATIFFTVAITGKNFKGKRESSGNKLGVIGYVTALLGTVSALLYFIFRWLGIGHAPVSNMFEYTTFLGIAMALAFTIIYPIYKSYYLGLFTMPIVMLIIAYASVFPTEVQPLIPALKSDWLYIHVITVALGQGILAISFAAGLLYLIRVIDFKKRTKGRAAIEFIMFSLLSVLAYIMMSIGFNGAGYEAEFSYVNKDGKEAEMVYHLPALIGPNQGELLTEEKLSPFLSAPAMIKSNDLNTVIWSLLGGIIFYILIRLVLRKTIAGAIQPFLKFVDPDTVDEISYRAIAIGFPVFTLGGLIFAMIWAQIAWTRFWGWDPKEVWALITFLFYAAYLHLRLSRGWQGEKSAWLCVIGFVIIIFNLIFVNLVIAGLHAYV